MREFVALTKALADENRIRILMSLNAGERCVCEIIALFKLAPSTISKHIAILHQAGLVESRKEGRWVYYRLPDRDVSQSAAKAIEWLQGNLRKDPVTQADAKRLKAVCQMSRKALCSCYKES
jgi:ArsR family transcriptional regulator, arsenate/arsenite/antimonite-responsive transcriptional repressor